MQIIFKGDLVKKYRYNAIKLLLQILAQIYFSHVNPDITVNTWVITGCSKQHLLYFVKSSIVERLLLSKHHLYSLL